VESSSHLCDAQLKIIYDDRGLDEMDKPITYLLSEKDCTDCTEFYLIIGDHTDFVRTEAQDRKLYTIINQYKKYITVIGSRISS